MKIANKLNIKNNKLYQDAVWIKHSLSRLDIKPAYLIVAAFLSLGAALFEGVSIAFSIPLVKGVIAGDFSLAKNLPIIKVFISRLSQKFTAPNTTIFILLILIIFISAVLKNVMQYLASLAIAEQFRRFSNNLRKLIFNRYLSFGQLFFDNNNIGYLHNILLNFATSIGQQLGELGIMFTHVFLLVMYMVLMFVISWKLTVFILVIFPILNRVSSWLIKKIEKTSGFYAQCYGMLSNRISNILTGISLVKLYTAEEKEKEHFGSLSNRLEGLEYSIDKKRNLLIPAQEIIILLGILFLISAMAFMFVKEKSGSIGNFMVFFYILKKSQSIIGALGNIRASFAVVSGPISEISKILDDNNKFFIEEGKKEFPGLKREIRFNHLSFSYKKEIEVIKDIMFCIEKGKMIAIVGPTGAGKTTLINLILRFYDSPSSSILVDDVDIREFSLRSLRANMALVSQDVLLFNDSLRNNITYGLNEPIAEERLNEVVRQARLSDFIITLPEGLETNIGDRGIKLSGGEKQRVSIARALLKGASILILDEATSSLDTKTEKLIQEAINEAVKNKTVIVIAHRLSTIQHADRVIVIENGRLVEEGSLGELLEEKGKFYEYWQEQKFY